MTFDVPLHAVTLSTLWLASLSQRKLHQTEKYAKYAANFSEKSKKPLSDVNKESQLIAVKINYIYRAS